MVAQKKLSEVTLEIFEEQEDAFHYPISSQNEARAFVKALHGKGIDYNEICEAIGEFEHNFCSWRKGLGRQGIGLAIISLINEPFKDLLLSDEESEEEEDEEPVILRQDVIKAEEKLRLSRVEQLREEAAKMSALAVVEPSSDDITDSTDDNISDFSSRGSSVEKWLEEKSERLMKEETEREIAKKEEDIVIKKEEQIVKKEKKEELLEKKEILAKKEDKIEKKEDKIEKKEDVVIKEKKKAEFGKKVEQKEENATAAKRERVCVKIEKEEVKETKKEEKEREEVSNGMRDEISSDSSSVVEAEITEGYDSDLDPEGVDPNSDKAALLRQVTALKAEMESNDAGFLYIFTDSSKFASRPRLKIGCSRFPQKRLEQAMKFNTDIRMVFSVEVTQRKSALESVCMQLKPYRMDTQEDWFKAAQDKAIRVVTETAKIFTDNEEEDDDEDDDDSETAC